EPDWDTFWKLGSRVGWRQNNEWLSYESYTFSTNAPVGHLPFLPWVGPRGVPWTTFLFSRL
ncbi:GUN4 domain-containing protein, partial [Dolichospermum circinale]